MNAEFSWCDRVRIRIFPNMMRIALCGGLVGMLLLSVVHFVHPLYVIDWYLVPVRAFCSGFLLSSTFGFLVLLCFCLVKYLTFPRDADITFKYGEVSIWENFSGQVKETLFRVRWVLLAILIIFCVWGWLFGSAVIMRLFLALGASDGLTIASVYSLFFGWVAISFCVEVTGRRLITWAQEFLDNCSAAHRRMLIQRAVLRRNDCP